MQGFEILESDKFNADLEEAAFWLYALILLAFLDSKYPQSLREFQFDE